MDSYSHCPVCGEARTTVGNECLCAPKNITIKLKDLDDLCAENERLKNWNDHDSERLKNENIALRAENERLRGALDSILCLAVEGPGIMPKGSLAKQVAEIAADLLREGGDDATK